ncbi:MAG: hypothetical protein WC626_03305 [Methanoregula sp.]
MNPQPRQFRQIASKKGNVRDYHSPVFMETTSPDLLDQFAEKFRSTGIDIGIEEFSELKVLEEFLGRHVLANRICDVQCMMLWSEWVRTVRSQTPGYPKLILEKVFREVITENYGIKVANYNGFRGPVYPGIKFVP